MGREKGGWSFAGVDGFGRGSGSGSVGGCERGWVDVKGVGLRIEEFEDYVGGDWLRCIVWYDIVHLFIVISSRYIPYLHKPQ